MTLILSLATPDVVIQVADRRLIDLRNNSAIDENSNKSISYCGATTFGYTGLAKIRGTPTDEWLASVIAGAPSMFEVVHQLKDAATDEFRKIQVTDRRWKRHSFVGAGWGTTAPGAPLQPHFWVVSNFIDENCRPTVEPSDEFRIATYRCGGAPFVLNATGQRVPKWIKAQLSRNLARCLERRTSPVPLAELMVRAVREVAEFNPAVGKGLLVSAIPRAALESGSAGIMLLASEPIPDERTFLYLDEHDLNSHQLGPIYVCRGTIMSNFEARAI